MRAADAGGVVTGPFRVDQGQLLADLRCELRGKQGVALREDAPLQPPDIGLGGPDVGQVRDGPGVAVVHAVHNRVELPHCQQACTDQRGQDQHAGDHHHGQARPRSLKMGFQATFLPAGVALLQR
ncbi:hypothetical protein D3C81_1622940 [compost metagenome]